MRPQLREAILCQDVDAYIRWPGKPGPFLLETQMTSTSFRRLRTSIASLCLLVGLILSASVAQAIDETEVIDAALVTYVHGMTDEIAQETVGPEGVPVLLRLLADPSFPRRDNVVAYLAYLGDDSATAALTAFLRNPPASLDVAEEDRLQPAQLVLTVAPVVCSGAWRVGSLHWVRRRAAHFVSMLVKR